MSIFVAVAQARSFRAAADQLGITRSAVSQAVRRLEDALGTALLHRTTRSVGLTEAGEAFLARVSPALDDLDSAAQAVIDSHARPSGLLRLAVSSIAESVLSGDMLTTFADAYPEVRLDILVTDEEFDIIAHGFDAGVRLGEVIEQDMIAVPVSGRQRQMVVAAPSYLERCGRPAHPRDLPAHRCIGWRPAPGISPYRWEFAEAGREFAVAVDPEVTTNDMSLMIRMACAGAGLTFGMAESFRSWIAKGELLSVLDDYCPAFPGFFLFYPSRRNLAPKLHALVDHVRTWRQLGNVSSSH
ncbi:LysR family transcriptional regulator [Sphingomonas sp. IC-11]|uniref:LysR family transcriptional regulator n=1 Tax=Sphingomonas sp. IC-11 TaxID=2898528 RepID=UPI001E444638|nr:LysR family transcriptional regulator [Sphingomonas sp. IC-11]MCD2317598.1 LysR family transcriptional regulator [Sphingomonas sp. IC-11]